ncbi:hypothetical protein AB4Z54_10995, partial [Streptomyces sp. MCAF7]
GGGGGGGCRPGGRWLRRALPARTPGAEHAYSKYKHKAACSAGAPAPGTLIEIESRHIGTVVALCRDRSRR